MLESLGVEPDVELVYRALLGTPRHHAGRRWPRWWTSRSRASRRPSPGWSTSGLALRSDDEAYVVAPPAVALGALITERRDGLRLAEQALASLAEEHRAATAGRTHQRADRGGHRRRRDPPPLPAGAAGGRDRAPHVRHRAVRGRPARGRTTPSRPPRTAASGSGRCSSGPCSTSRPPLDEVVDSLRRGLELRVVDTLPLKLVLADTDLGAGAAAGRPGRSRGEPGAVLLQRSGLLAALSALFESVWRPGLPADARQPRRRRAHGRRRGRRA